jgi:non-heme chloroperoxidase
VAEAMGEIKTSDGVTLRYEEAGSGRPLVLVPGWSQTAAQFKHQLAGLGDRYRVIALDPRGHGNSDRPAYGYRISRFAKDLHDALVALDLTEVNLLSHSMGCSVVWCYWDLFGSERLSKLIFVDQSPFLTANPSWSQAEREAAEFALDPPSLRDDPITLYRIQNLIDAVTGLAGPNGEDMTRQFIGSMFTNRTSEQEKTWIIDNVLKLPRRYAARLVYNHATQDWFDVVKRIDLPTLLIGACASQIPWKSMVWLHDHIPNSRLELFEAAEGGKHFLFMENPEKFNRLVADFIG